MPDNYDNLNYLTSVGSYKKLDYNYFHEGNKQECTKLQQKISNGTEAYLFCMRYTGNLKNYDKLEFFDKLKQYKCTYFSLWVYDQFSRFKDKEHSTVRTLILDQWNEFQKKNECNSSKFVTYMAMNSEYLKAKKLYDYALNYAKLHLDHEESSLPCSTKDKVYIEKSLELYNEIKAECVHDNKVFTQFCVAYRDVQNIYPNDQLLNIQCKSIKDEILFDSEDEEEEFISGESYYSSVSSFSKYEEEFNTDNEDTSYTEDHGAQCSNISNTHFTSSEFIKRCNRIAKYIHDIKGKTDNTDERCKCLNYLLNSNTKLNTFSNHSGSKLFKAYKDIAENMNKCNLIIDYINETDIKKIEILYNLHKAMDKLDNSIKSDDGNIYSNAQAFAELYRKNIDDCSTHNTDAYCNEFKVFERYCYERTKPENYTKASDILKTLIPQDGTSSIIASCIMILGTTFILYILYKFTPLGHWANAQIQKKKKMLNYLPESETQLHNHRHEILNIDNSKFNIKYHST
ncbi:PIR protein [Plasmodium ovale]|uniref:PIR Superfamily Protein n=2 Tax=Plasmodium ovale TaxID=36330 RepID=A0A1A8XBC7_PLAOA|nr:PIR Superfamily Protein [Plasmodium ovale curtisi]SBT83279.1 PIR protein [Plasmodium ovale]